MRLWASRSTETARENSQKNSPNVKAVEISKNTSHHAPSTLSSAKNWNPDTVSPIQKHADVRNWLKNVGLSMHEDYLIDPEINKIYMGLGWDKGADVDASAVLFDEHLRPIDVVWYKQLSSKCGSVEHSGDNLTGEGDGDDEVITVKLGQLPLHVHHVLFSVTVFSYDVSFSQIRSAYVRMMTDKEANKNHQMCHYSLTQMSGHAMHMGLLTRRGSYWNFRALGTPASGRTAREMLENPKNLECLSANPSIKPELRFVTVSVIRGTDLAAKDVSGIFRRTSSSDPYYIIKFKNKTYTSEHRSQTLEPEWPSISFALGWTTEVESAPLTIQIFDYDAVGKDDFMGEVKVPTHSLFNLGAGDHVFWFSLSHSKQREYRNEEVSGKILVAFNIQASYH